MSIRFPAELKEYGYFDFSGNFKVTKSMPKDIEKIYKDYQETLKKFYSTSYLEKSLNELTEEDLIE